MMTARITTNQNIHSFSRRIDRPYRRKQHASLHGMMLDVPTDEFPATMSLSKNHSSVQTILKSTEEKTVSKRNIDVADMHVSDWMRRVDHTGKFETRQTLSKLLNPRTHHLIRA
jgi:hypothetical protein